jgi:hypothetical protein
VFTARYVLLTQCIYVFSVKLRTNSDYFTVQYWLVFITETECVYYAVRTMIVSCKWSSLKDSLFFPSFAVCVRQLIRQTWWAVLPNIFVVGVTNRSGSTIFCSDFFYVAFISLLDVLSALYLLDLINIRKLKALLLLVASVCWFKLLVFLRIHPRTDANTSTIGSRNRRAPSCFVTLCSCFEHCHVASSGCCATLCISLVNPLLGVPKVVCA